MKHHSKVSLLLLGGFLMMSAGASLLISFSSAATLSTVTYPALATNNAVRDNTTNTTYLYMGDTTKTLSYQLNNIPAGAVRATLYKGTQVLNYYSIGTDGTFTFSMGAKGDVVLSATTLNVFYAKFYDSKGVELAQKETFNVYSTAMKADFDTKINTFKAGKSLKDTVNAIGDTTVDNGATNNTVTSHSCPIGYWNGSECIGLPKPVPHGTIGTRARIAAHGAAPIAMAAFTPTFMTIDDALKSANIGTLTAGATLDTIASYFNGFFGAALNAITSNLGQLMKYLDYMNINRDYMSQKMDIDDSVELARENYESSLNAKIDAMSQALSATDATTKASALRDIASADANYKSDRDILDQRAIARDQKFFNLDAKNTAVTNTAVLNNNGGTAVTATWVEARGSMTKNGVTTNYCSTCTSNANGFGDSCTAAAACS